MIRLVEISKVYNAGRTNAFVAVDTVTLTIAARTVTALQGPSGSGKTTLLSLAGCMARPTSVRIFLGERELTSLPERFLTDIRRRTFGFVFQQFNLIKGITVLENVMLPAYPSGERHGVVRARALELLDRLGLADKGPARVEWLSGGEAQRTAIARALINTPAVLIADEPTAHLDTALSREFMEIMGQLKDQGTSILIASHDPLVRDAAVIDRIVEMRDGRLVTGGGPG